MAKFIFATKASSYMNKMRFSMNLGIKDAPDQENCKLIPNKISKRKLRRNRRKN